METKYCTKCAELKPTSDFHRSKATPTGYTNYCGECSSDRSRKWRKDNKEMKLHQNLRYKYGITREDYLRLLEDCKGCCEICGLPQEKSPREKLFVDHCHKTDAVRGLLCQSCNNLLGASSDSEEILSKAIVYLKKKPPLGRLKE